MKECKELLMVMLLGVEYCMIIHLIRGWLDEQRYWKSLETIWLDFGKLDGEDEDAQ